MKKIFLVLAMVLLSASLAYAGYVKGYTRSDGTYVRGHYRSEPNSTKSDNYGPSQSTNELYNPYARDYDNDGISNMYDYDDDNDGWMDDYDNAQYNDDYY